MKNKKNKPNIWLIIGGMLMIVALWGYFMDFVTPDVLSDIAWFNAVLDKTERITYDEYNSMLEAKNVVEMWYSPGNEEMILLVDDMSLLGDYVYNNMTPPASQSEFRTDGYLFKTLYPAGETFREDIIKKGVILHYIIDDSSNKTLLLMQIVSLLLPAFGLVYFILMASRSFKPSSLKAEDIIQKSDTKLEDIIGLDEVMEDINLVIKLIKDPTYGESIGAKTPKGILLTGPPGVGKTMIAQAISYEAGVSFISLSGSDFKEIFVGNGAKRVRDSFRIAREQENGCIVFIDELDAIGEKRSSVVTNSEDTQTINALLKEMDGFKKHTGVFVLAATNHPDKLDPAITRAGRFDRKINIRPPRDWEVRQKMFNLYLKDKKVGDDVDFETLSRQVAGFTGADIQSVCNEAALVALSKEMEYITHDCIEDAIDRILFEGSKSKHEVNPKDKEIVAYHEASHAIMSILTKQPVARISIQSTTSGVGGAVMREEGNSCFQTKEDFESLIMVCYAGRVGESIRFSSVTTGASNDITKATTLIDEYVNRFGFYDKGVVIDKSALASRYVSVNIQDELIKEVAGDLYKRCQEKLKENFGMVEKLATHLLQVEKMTGKQVYEYLGIMKE